MATRDPGAESTGSVLVSHSYDAADAPTTQLRNVRDGGGPEASFTEKLNCHCQVSSLISVTSVFADSGREYRP